MDNSRTNLRLVTAPPCSTAAEPPTESVLAERRAITAPNASVAALRSSTAVGLLPTEVGQHVEASTQLCARPQGLPEVVLVYCTSGLGWCEAQGKRFEIKAGQLLLIPSHVAHSYGADAIDPWSLFWCHLDGTTALDYLDELDNDGRPMLLELGQDPKVFGLWLQLISALERDTSTRGLRFASRLLVHLTGLIAYRHANSQLPSAAERVVASIESMKQNLEQNLSVSRLCTEAQLSPSYYSLLFKRATGSSPMAYFSRLRMEWAAELLRAPNASLQGVSHRLGYDDPFQFAGAFRSVWGTSPRSVRRQQVARTN